MFASLSLTSSIIDARERHDRVTERYLRMLIIPRTVKAADAVVFVLDADAVDQFALGEDRSAFLGLHWCPSTHHRLGSSRPL